MSVLSILVDTSAWIEYLRGTASSYHFWIRDAINNGVSLKWTDPVLYELTAGAGSNERAESLRALLLRGPMLPVAGLQDWEDAAQLYRTARSRGLTVRSTVDCLIAAVAIRTASGVLAYDRDFDALARVSDLELIKP